MRPSEYVLAGYFLYAGLLFFLFDTENALQRAGLNLALIGIIWMLQRLRGPAGSAVRDWTPLVLIPVAYWEMGWIARPHTRYDLEQAWVAWDRLLLDRWGMRAFLEGFGPFVPALLELSYALVYAMPPVALGAVYAFGYRERAERLLFPLLLGTLACYALYPYFPVYPPRFVFPGLDFPTIENPIRGFNWLFLGKYAVNTNVFPSGHVAAAFAAAFGVLLAVPERKAAGWTLVFAAALIAVSTVYGRYHYAVDAAAGFSIAVAAAGIAKSLSR